MKKRILIKLVLAFLYFTFPLFSANVKHDLKEFLNLSSGERVTHPCILTKAKEFHRNNITGKGIKIAILDTIFHPEDIDILNIKGCILPSAIQKKLVLSSHECLESLDLEELKAKPNSLPEDQKLIIRKEYFDSIDTYKHNGLGHGTMVMRLLHSMAPDLQLLPIDLACQGVLKENVNTTNLFASAVREAINNNVNAINISYHVLSSLNRDYINALKEASERGIAIICAAGNGSTKERAICLDTVKYETNSLFYGRDEKKAFEELKGKGMLFCGSLGLDSTGEEYLSAFSQHPDRDTLDRYVLAPGENIIAPLMVPGTNSLNCDIIPREGTSYSTPIATGIMALLLQRANDKKLTYKTEDILRIMHNSGHNLTHNIPGTPFKKYKALNINNAMRQVDDLNRPSPPPAVKSKKPTFRKRQKLSSAKKSKPQTSVVLKKTNKKRNSIRAKKLSIHKSGRHRKSISRNSKLRKTSHKKYVRTVRKRTKTIKRKG